MGHLGEHESELLLAVLEVLGALEEAELDAPDLLVGLALFEEQREVHFTLFYCAHFFFVQPLQLFAVLPDSSLHFAFSRVENAQAMLLPVSPHSTVLLPIGPLVLAVPLLLVCLVIAYVFAAILPMVDAKTFNDVVSPLTLEISAVRPFVVAPTFYQIVSPFSLEYGAIRPLVDAEAVLSAHDVVPRIL